jgi:hypothetical protein
MHHKFKLEETKAMFFENLEFKKCTVWMSSRLFSSTTTAQTCF